MHHTHAGRSIHRHAGRHRHHHHHHHTRHTPASHLLRYVLHAPVGLAILKRLPQDGVEGLPGALDGAKGSHRETHHPRQPARPGRGGRSGRARHRGTETRTPTLLAPVWLQSHARMQRVQPGGQPGFLPAPLTARKGPRSLPPYPAGLCTPSAHPCTAAGGGAHQQEGSGGDAGGNEAGRQTRAAPEVRAAVAPRVMVPRSGPATGRAAPAHPPAAW